MRERIGAAVGGDGPPVERVLLLADRANQRGANIMFCATEGDLQKVDEYMNSMTPVGESGRRTSVEMFEVVLDSDAQ